MRLRSGDINTIWENLQIEKHKSGRRSFRLPDWFVLFDLKIFSDGVYIPRAQPHAQSLFLFPIVFGINFISAHGWPLSIAIVGNRPFTRREIFKLHDYVYDNLWIANRQWISSQGNASRLCSSVGWHRNESLCTKSKEKTRRAVKMLRVFHHFSYNKKIPRRQL